MLSLKKRSSIYDSTRFYTRSRSDLMKPNFIFSSDIVEKVNKLAIFYQNLTLESSSQIDVLSLIDHALSINLKVELNKLVARKNNVSISALLDKNTYFLSKGDAKCELRQSDSLVLPKSALIFEGCSIRHDGIFIINFQLIVDKFLVLNKEDNVEVRIDFRMNEDYAILSSCIGDVSGQVEPYIQDIFNQMLAQKSQLCREGGLDTLKETSLIDEIQDEEYLDSSMEELLLLTSNETDTTIDFMDLSGEEFNTHLKEKGIGDFSTSRPNVQDKSFRIRKQNRGLLSSITEEKVDTFIDNINNLRHNDDEIIKIQEIPLISDNINHATYEDSATETESIPESHVHNDHSFFDSSFVVSSPVRPTKLLASASSSPQKEHTLSKKPSAAGISIINFEDDSPELKFAYSDDSSSVPTFIKRDKKFKFIKVGKVQKFVELFEGKLDSCEAPKH